MPSFDIVSEVEMNEAQNAVDNANRELDTRFDFRGVDASIELNDKTIKLKAEADSQVMQLFFNLGGAAHEIGVKQASYFLWKKYSSTHKVKFITVDFEPVVAEILENVENSQMGVVLKRMMMRAGSAVAEKLNIQALVTGESIGQVSSQTLANLSVIDRVTETLILRPLIQHDKQEIINIARQIGTAEMAETMPEYCGVISKKPTVKAKIEVIKAEEEKFDFDVLDTVIDNARIMDVRDIDTQAKQELKEAESVADLPHGSVVVDIRSPEEEDASPLDIEGIEVIHLPFFRLATKFGDLPKDTDYYLYCDRGVMSQQQDILHDRPTEIMSICGYISEQGKRYNIKTPNNDKLLGKILAKKAWYKTTLLKY